jgi:hypothetical protein
VASSLRLLPAGFGILLLAQAAFAQSAGEVERCFQNPGVCATAPSVAPPPPAHTGPAPAPRPGPDYASVLQSPDVERRRIQESLRTLEKYNGPIDGNLQSDGTVKGIGDWQRGRGAPVTGKLTPDEVQVLHADAAKAPIRRIEPPATPPATAARPPSNEEQLKALRARLAERRRVAEPKAKAASDALLADLKAFVASDGKGGAIREQFSSFAGWFDQTRAAGRSIGEIAPAVEDYGDARAGNAVTVEVRLDVKQDGTNSKHCAVFAWREQGTPPQRQETKSFSCDDVAAVEKWKSDQALRSAWR